MVFRFDLEEQARPAIAKALPSGGFHGVLKLLPAGSVSLCASFVLMRGCQA